MKSGEVDPDRPSKRANLQSLHRRPARPWQGDPTSTPARIRTPFITSAQNRAGKKVHLPRTARVAWPSERPPLLTVRAWCGQSFHNPELLEFRDDELDICLACILRKEMHRHPSHPEGR